MNGRSVTEFHRQPAAYVSRREKSSPRVMIRNGSEIQYTFRVNQGAILRYLGLFGKENDQSSIEDALNI